MAALFHNPRFRVVSSTGVPYNAARLFAYATGTTTPQNTWSDSALTSVNTNPLVSDSGGLFGPVYLDQSLSKYKFVCKTSVADGDTTLWTIDPYETGLVGSQTITGSLTLTGNLTMTGNHRVNGDVSVYDDAPRIFLSETDQGTNLQNWDVIIEGGVLSIRTRTDADGAGKNILVVTRGATTAISSIAIGNATDLPTITLNGTTLVATSILQETSSSFTGTFTGMTAATTGTVYYRKYGNIVTLYSGASIFGTSNTTAMTMTGLPSAIQPTGNRYCFAALMDNSAQIGGQAYLTASGTVEFSTAFAGTGAFTNSGSKGLFAGFCITYTL